MSDLVQRLRGIYTIPVDPDVGPLELEDGTKTETFTRAFQTSPIMHEAAAEIERLQALVDNKAAYANQMRVALNRMRGELQQLAGKMASDSVHLWSCKVVNDLKRLDGAIDYDGTESAQVVFRLANGRTLRVCYGELGLTCDQFEGLQIVVDGKPTTDIEMREARS